MKNEIEYKCNNCGHEGINTRAVPDVPELVAVSHEVFYAPTREWRKTVEPEYYRKNGDLVRDLIDKSKAAAMLAAKDNLISGLNDELQFMRKAAKENRQRAETAEAKLAQIKAQEPVAVVRFDRSDGNENEMPKVVSCNWLPDGNYPLYASPVDQTAEIERLRDVAKKVIARWDSPHWKVTAPTANVMNELRAALSGKDSK